MLANFDDYKDFSKAEFDCKHTGKNRMTKEFMDIMQEARNIYGKPMRITSGYRDKTHPVEASKKATGEHSYGVACDIAVMGEDVSYMISIFYALGVRRFGIQQKGSGRFLHVGIGDRHLSFLKTTWSY